jgi:hypothetical protein
LKGHDGDGVYDITLKDPFDSTPAITGTVLWDDYGWDGLSTGLFAAAG